jgi:hypothetical protein
VTQHGLRLAIWSGPRNISTAMMRAWGNRPDTFVCDEPLYAHYLSRVEAGHPGAEEVVRHHETDWRKVVVWLTGPIPEEREIFYQKQMAHHLLPDMDRDWLAGLTHGFLIRDPGRMLVSLAKHLAEPRLADTGLAQQLEIFEAVRARTGCIPPVIDARDVLTDPEGMLRRLCQSVGVAFTPRMLSWPAGRRNTDGIWARHWYREVELSTGFRPYRESVEPLPARLEALHDECRHYYERLHRHRLRVGPTKSEA